MHRYGAKVAELRSFDVKPNRCVVFQPKRELSPPDGRSRPCPIKNLQNPINLMDLRAYYRKLITKNTHQRSYKVKGDK
jgi:hypothetical protein